MLSVVAIIAVHTIILSTRTTGDVTEIALECSCGKVFAKQRFPKDDHVHRQAIRDDGWLKAVHHKEQVKPA